MVEPLSMLALKPAMLVVEVVAPVVLEAMLLLVMGEMVDLVFRF